MKRSGIDEEHELLLIDTCGPAASVALVRGQECVAERRLPDRTASAQLLDAVREVLGKDRRANAVGVVSGPGSFTGVRAGLAAAKAFCEAWDVPLIAVSRLEVLGEGMTQGLAVMDAGRGEVYVRDLQTGREQLMSRAEVDELIATGLPAVTDDEKLAASLPSALVRAIGAKDALAAVERGLAAGGSDVTLADANYVRGEREIYGKSLRNSAQ